MKFASTGTVISIKQSVTGYYHPDYAASLAEFGVPRFLAASGGWILQRPIAGTPYWDAMGCYPLFCCSNWSALAQDLEEIGDELTSLVLVTDPFGDYTEDTLRRAFSDLVKPFKKHFVVDLEADAEAFVDPHHRRYARKALTAVSIERCEGTAGHENEWRDLYANLVARHRIRGIARFSDDSFARQLKVPGGIILRALHEGETVGMMWWFVSGNVAYYHLGAYSDTGYELHASFALFWWSIELFKTEGLRWLNLGAGAGVDNHTTDGLSRFKRGWSTGVRPTYLCGRIFNRVRYEQVVKSKGIQDPVYFPAYRTGEFV
jgi:Acetyltransferase (GNAT) domain